MPDETLAGSTPESPSTPSQVSPPEGQLEGRWTEGLQDDALRVHPSLTKFQDVPSLAKSYVELESKIGAKGILLPGEDASPGEIRSAMAQLGCPEVPTNLGAPQIPEGLPQDAGFLESMRDVAWQNGLTPTQFQNISQALVNYQQNHYSEGMQTQQQAVTEAQEELKQKWGAALPEKLKLAQDAALAIYGPEVNASMQLMGPTGAIGNHPEMLDILAKLGQSMQEGGIVSGARAQPALTPQDAQDQINQAMLDKEFMAALHDEKSPAHKEAYARWSTLYNSANSGVEGPNREQSGVFIR